MLLFDCAKSYDQESRLNVTRSRANRCPRLVFVMVSKLSSFAAVGRRPRGTRRFRRLSPVVVDRFAHRLGDGRRRRPFVVARFLL